MTMKKNDKVNGDDTTALVVSKDVVAAIRGTLVRFKRRAFLLEDVPEVQTRALAAARRGPMPRDVAEWKALAATIAKRYAIDEIEKYKARRKYHQGLCEDPDAFGPIPEEHRHDPVDAKRYLGVLGDCFEDGEMPELGGEILWGVAEEVEHKEIAEETDLSCNQVKYRLERMRGTFRDALVERGLRVELTQVGVLAVPMDVGSDEVEDAPPDRETG